MGDFKQVLEDIAKIRQGMLSVLCDPEGKPCFAGSDGDRAVIQELLTITEKYKA